MKLPALSGASLMLLTVLAFVIQDAAVKFLVGAYGVAQIVLLRTSITLALVTAAAGWGGFRALRTRNAGLHVVRGLMLLVSSTTFFYGFGHLPLADAYTIFYMVPLAMTVLAAVVLKEPVPKRAAQAIALGLLGVGVVVGPQLAGGELLAYLACALGTLTYAFVGVITRRLSGNETPLALLFYPCLVMVLSTLPLAPFDWATPTPRDLAIIVAIGLLWPVAHGLFAAALKRSAIARLAPYEYSSIVWVVAIDFFVFSISPSMTTLIGSAIIIVACLLLVERSPAAEAAKT